MKLAFSTNAYLNFSFAEAVSRLAAIGYKGVEIMADVPHAWPAFLLEEQKQAIHDALARQELSISNINDQKVPTFVGTPGIGRLVITRLQYAF